MKKVNIVALLSAFAAPPAIAADTGFYIGVKFGSVNYDYANVSNNSQAGYGLLGGYIVNDYFAAEAEFNHLGGFDTVDSIIKGKSFGISGVGTLPLNPEFSLFGKLGITSSSLEDSPQPGYLGGVYTHTNTGLNIGFGGQFNVNETVGIRFGYDSYPVGDTTSSTSQAGMLYIGGIFNF